MRLARPLANSSDSLLHWHVSSTQRRRERRDMRREDQICRVAFQAAMTPFLGACSGGAGFSLPIRAKLGLYFLKLSSLRLSLRLCAECTFHGVGQ